MGVTGYGLYRGGTRVATTAGTTGIVSGLTCGTNYTLAVDAYDAAGNRPPQAVLMVSTTACPDTQPPSTPTGLTSRTSHRRASPLGWAASSDNVGGIGYDVFRNGTKVGSTTSATSVQSGLTCSTAYTFAVAAYDAAGNRSMQAQVLTTTAACSPTTTSLGVIELSGSVSPSTVEQKIAAAPAGPVTVRPAQGGSVTVNGDLQVSRSNVALDRISVQGIVSFRSGSTGSKLLNGTSSGFDIRGGDNILVEGNTFDGKCQRAQNWVVEEPAGQIPNNTVIRNNTFRNYYMCSNPSTHTEALFVAYSDGGVIEGNTFEDNGTTGHLFVRRSQRNPEHEQLRAQLVRPLKQVRPRDQPLVLDSVQAQIPASANTNVDPSSNTSDRLLVGPTQTEANAHTKSC